MSKAIWNKLRTRNDDGAMRKNKTRLVQRKISSPMDAPFEFSKASVDEIPLVLIPSSRWSWSCSYNVPSGVSSIVHRWGRDAHTNPQRLATEGINCAPSCEEIAFCVTQQACTYSAPVKSCPTRDNVMVDCELTLVFAIGPEPEQVKNFVYKLGAKHFDIFLAAAVEESIRHLIRSCKHTDIYELRGSNDERVVLTLKELNKKFHEFGVNFRSAAITDVRFNTTLQGVLQDTTNFNSKIYEQSKRQKHEMDAIQFKMDKEMTELKRSNERRLQDLGATRRRFEIEKDIQKIDADADRMVEGLQSRQRASVAEVRAETDLELLEKKEQAIALEKIAQAEAEAIAARKRVQAECERQIIESEAELKAAEDIAKSIILQAEAEEESAQDLVTKRKHNVTMAKLDIMQDITKTAKITVAGAQADTLVDELVAVHDL
eukprot:TRINITY_DN67716_c11_g12_i1.p1 TRINITY_DN67716_c11_g12~~TRINITY_DN67716_c11_g12_i1.p1  ORF type:complete len:432 (-),score=249.49 TRINITY_DN67716_c11_g12_i1:116-1411(-)